MNELLARAVSCPFKRHPYPCCPYASAVLPGASSASARSWHWDIRPTHLCLLRYAVDSDATLSLLLEVWARGLGDTVGTQATLLAAGVLSVTEFLGKTSVARLMLCQVGDLSHGIWLHKHAGQSSRTGGLNLRSVWLLTAPSHRTPHL